ncbi:DNA-3-methyladenine glycosylase 2 family protein [Chitinophaga agrisoli]|uniref:DNA-3-methyladenine glycosylase II n=1 Tax=Chitinophaga agrisoli TaxID=2607653 RepID=A0A5B2VIQ8_9BACT|nr:DNA glycosylase [Chitinophaga agrisoli]KAA2239473.1 DNA-3-methyladenine glycosylase 2 family protein [Chitinophaga agrisoli]
MIRIPILHPHQFSFAESLQFLNRSNRECLHFVRNGSLERLIIQDGAPLLLNIREAAGKQALEVAVVNNWGIPVDEDNIRRFVTHWLHLDADLQPFYQFAAEDAVLRPLVEQYKGLRLVGIPDLFESITWTITGQQISLPFAYTLRKRFIEAFGYHERIGWEDYYTYPHPAVVAGLQPEDLTGMQFSRSKALYIIQIAAAIADGRLDNAQLQQMEYEAARAYLLQWKGIGNWSANYVLMKYLRFPEALPLEDAGLHNALRRQLQLDAKPSLAAVKEYTQHWRQHAAYATFYLWRSLS